MARQYHVQLMLLYLPQSAQHLGRVMVARHLTYLTYGENFSVVLMMDAELILDGVWVVTKLMKLNHIQLMCLTQVMRVMLPAVGFMENAEMAIIIKQQTLLLTMAGKKPARATWHYWLALNIKDK